MRLLPTSSLLTLFSWIINLSSYCGGDISKRPVRSGIENFKIGFTFPKGRKKGFLDQVLDYTIQDINSAHAAFRYEASISHVEEGNLLDTSQTLCRSVAKGATIQILPQEVTAAALMQSTCDHLELVCLDIYQRYPESMFSSFSLYPDVTVTGTAFVELLHHLGLNRSAAIVSKAENIPRLDHILWNGRPYNISVSVFHKNAPSYRPLLRHLRLQGILNFVVAVNEEELVDFLQNVLQLQMHDSSYTYVFLGLDLLVQDLSDVWYIGLNVYALTPVDIINHQNSEKIARITDFAERNGVRLRIPGHSIPTTLPLEAAVLYDTLQLLAIALQNFVPLSDEPRDPVSCDHSSRWPLGTSILNYLNAVAYEGLTGKISMKTFKRQENLLHVLKLTENGFTNVGTWTTAGGLEMLPVKKAASAGKPAGAHTGTVDDPLVVVSILQDPFLMLKEEFKKELKEENRTFVDSMATKQNMHGFVIDLLDQISAVLRTDTGAGFEYEVYLVPDKQFGVLDKASGNWSGMVKELLSGTATLAVAPFTITADREAYISFTKPYWMSGIGIVYQAPRGSAPSLFALMRSLSAKLWMAWIGAAVLVGFSMWIIARFSPLEWENRHLCTGVETNFAVNAFNLRNSMWFSFCSLLMQGCDINPRAVSTRFLGGSWWFFTLFLSTHFVAKLASVLTVEKMSVPFSSVDELLQHPEIQYGIIGHGSTYEFFRDSKIETYKQMFARMNESVPSAFVSSLQEGVNRVLNEKYAFLVESTEIQYVTERNCNLTKIGELLNTIQFGIGTAKDSPWNEKISMAILKLIEGEEITGIQQKWWKRGNTCSKDETSTGPQPINTTLVGGAFLILVVGLVVAILMAVFEFVWNALRNAHIDKASLWTELLLELRHALRFRASATRPVLQKQCRTCGVEIHSLAAAQSHEHKDYTPMKFLNNAIRRRHASIFG